ncbi:MAG: hypothetical protein KKA73_17865 [Chloroflexi bacterium]|nr:hypothetical protein [Chloroflexota bacterium]MBU1749554.1 hypothetical protein [Chloroflexota bacterium]
MKATTYQIQVQGKLDESWSQWFQGLTVTVEGDVTTLTGPVADQAALRGLLTRILDLNLVLVSVVRVQEQHTIEEVSDA